MSSARLDRGPEGVDRPRTRRALLRSGAAAAVAGAIGVLGSVQIASARNGQPVRAGERVNATRVTTVESNKAPAMIGRSTLSGAGIGVRGIATGRAGLGVSGVASASKGETVGVKGETSSPDGTAGVFEAADGGTALAATSGQKGGVALRTRGKLQLTERSGVASVSGGAEFVIPVAGGLGSGTFVLATLQDHRPGVHVEAATVLDADEGLIVVRLSQALAEPTKVGWLVLD